MCYLVILGKYQQHETIEHKYLVRGHTHLETNFAHSIIEKKIEETNAIKNYLNEDNFLTEVEFFINKKFCVHLHML